MTPRFCEDTKSHVMKICHNEGLYRHLHFADPESLRCYFDLFTTPNALGISGDMGTYIFSRLEDMFLFFDTPNGRLNPDYWSEKVTAQDVHCPVRVFSKAKFEEVVLQDFNDRKYMFDPPQQVLLLAEIESNIFNDPDAYHDIGAREALRNFEFSYESNNGGPRLVFDYEDYWEWDFKDFSPHFMWCLEAIVFGIRRYREVTGNVR